MTPHLFTLFKHMVGLIFLFSKCFLSPCLLLGAIVGLKICGEQNKSSTHMQFTFYVIDIKVKKSNIK